MTSATGTRPKNALTELEALERAWQEAADKANYLAREHSEKMRRLHRWLDDPGLLDRLAALQQGTQISLGQPVSREGQTPRPCRRRSTPSATPPNSFPSSTRLAALR